MYKQKKVHTDMYWDKLVHTEKIQEFFLSRCRDGVKDRARIRTLPLLSLSYDVKHSRSAKG